MIDQILRVYDLSSPSEKSEGASWYARERAYAAGLAEQYDQPIEVVIGMLAVLSPRQSYITTHRTVERMLFVYSQGKNPYRYKWAGLGLNVEKALGILTTGDVDRYVRGDKVSAFYDNILNPQGSGRVTVDVWALRVVAGLDASDKSLTTKQYNEIALTYQQAAALINLNPVELQAITWLAVKRLARYGENQLTLF